MEGNYSMSESSSYSGGRKCECGYYPISNLITIVINLKNQGKTVFKKSTIEFGSGRYGKVYHAFWPDRNICVSIKEVNKGHDRLTDERAKNEVEIHKYINENIAEDERNYIIKICKGSKCCWNSNIYLSIVMELGGMNLKDYFEENDVIISTFELMQEEETSFSERREEFLTNIFKCAAKALQQFHEFGIHLDIKADNFIISKEQNSHEPLELCKLIDFNSSIIIPKGEDRIIENLQGNMALAPEIFEGQSVNNGSKVHIHTYIYIHIHTCIFRLVIKNFVIN
uniref:Protein kinase domain-containing protein n=1 Tax=Meloidogyne floridensis TaxID=298350 RepID=A0A915NND4_9BILA